MKETYQQMLRTPAWRRKRLEIIQAAGGKCEDCGKAPAKLEVHHCAYLPGERPENHGRDLLMCLCPACHTDRQRIEDVIHVTWGRLCRHTAPNKLRETAWFLMEYATRLDHARQAVKVFGGDLE